MRRIDLSEDRGSTIPLILGFFLIGLLVVAGSVMASDAFTKQRDLQSMCDGAALAASNAVNGPAARSEDLGENLPLDAVQDAVDAYLARDVDRRTVRVQATLSTDGTGVLADCTTRSKVAFGTLIGRGGGVDQYARSSAQGILQ
jgi:hypothetical protein